MQMRKLVQISMCLLPAQDSDDEMDVDAAAAAAAGGSKARESVAHVAVSLTAEVRGPLQSAGLT